MPSVIFIAAIFLPLFLLAAVLWGFRKRYDNQACEPFNDLPLRPPGESLRIEVKRIDNSIDDSVLTLAGLILMGSLPFLTTHNLRVAFVAWVICLTFSLGLCWHLKVLLQKRWNYELGYTGERVVGEELNQLLADGFKVFHDVCFDNYNIDHVVVGVCGVFAIETKTRRKPSKSSAKPNHRVAYDGQKLMFPRWTDAESPKQANLSARSLSGWLAQATGESVWVQPILTIPGWYIDRTTLEPVAVLNSKEIRKFILSQTRESISKDQVQRIIFRLSERCRMPAK